jgi:hypothetical protein
MNFKNITFIKYKMGTNENNHTIGLGANSGAFISPYCAVLLSIYIRKTAPLPKYDQFTAPHKSFVSTQLYM